MYCCYSIGVHIMLFEKGRGLNYLCLPLSLAYRYISGQPSSSQNTLNVQKINKERKKSANCHQIYRNGVKITAPLYFSLGGGKWGGWRRGGKRCRN